MTNDSQDQKMSLEKAEKIMNNYEDYSRVSVNKASRRISKEKDLSGGDSSSTPEGSSYTRGESKTSIVDYESYGVGSGEPPKPDGVLMRYPNAVNDRWRFYSDPEYGKLSDNAERKKVFSADTIQNIIQHYLNYHRDELVDKADDGDESEFSRGFRKALEELEEVFSDD